MEFIQTAINSIMEFFSSVWDWMCNFSDSFFMLFEYIELASVTAYNFINTLPFYLRAFATGTVTISILYLVLGRSTGGKV